VVARQGPPAPEAIQVRVRRALEMLTRRQRDVLFAAHVRREPVDWGEEREAATRLAEAMALALVGRGR
jgi:hypothetical protein